MTRYTEHINTRSAIDFLKDRLSSLEQDVEYYRILADEKESQSKGHRETVRLLTQLASDAEAAISILSDPNGEGNV